MKTCKDLVYMMTLSNQTEDKIAFKVKFRLKDPAEVPNLRWPVNGIRGTLAAKTTDNVVLLQKIHPVEGVAGEKAEIEKLDIQLTSKIIEVKVASAEGAKDDAKQGAASSVDNVGTTANTNGKGGTEAAALPFYDPQDVGVAGSSDQKSCAACTMFNSKSATSCSICGGTAFN